MLFPSRLQEEEQERARRVGHGVVLVVVQARTMRQCGREKRGGARMVQSDLNSQLCETLCALVL